MRRTTPWRAILIALALLAATLVHPHTAAAAPRAVGGILDLGAWNLERDGPVRLDGEWHFYWNQLLEPAHLADQDIQPVVIEAPQSWNRKLVDGQSLPGSGFATYVLEILLEGSPEVVALAVPPMSTAYTLFVNGHLKATNGVVGATPTETTPQYRNEIVTVVPEGGSITLVLQVANFDHRRGGMWRSIIIGTDQDIVARAERGTARDMFLVGSILIMTLYHYGLYLLHSGNMSSFHFANFSLFTVLRTLTVGEILLTRFFPQMSWHLLLKLDYLSLLSIPCFVFFLRAHYPNETSPAYTRAAQWIGGAYALVVLLAPIAISSQTILAYQVFILSAIAYSVTVLSLASLRKRDGAALFLGGIVVIGATAVNDILFYNDLIRSFDLTPLGLFVFILMQSIVLAVRSARVSHQRELLASELQRSRRVITEREEALRREMAEILHGRVQTRLLIAWHRLKQTRGLIHDKPAEAALMIDEVSVQLETIRENEVRHVSHRLHPKVIDIGLLPAVHSLADDFRDHFDVAVNPGERLRALDQQPGHQLPKAVCVTAYRCLEEALGNVSSHAAAAHVRIDINLAQDDTLDITVVDDGRGFDLNAETRGLGLEIIGSRVAELGGTWRIESSPGSGTTLTLRLPIEREELATA